MRGLMLLVALAGCGSSSGVDTYHGLRICPHASTVIVGTCDEIIRDDEGTQYPCLTCIGATDCLVADGYCFAS